MNQETDTPQTSEIETAYQQQRESVGGIIEHARELERELNAAKAEIARLEKWTTVNGILAHDYSIAAVKFKGQRDEAIRELSHIADLLDGHFDEGGTIAGLGTTNKARQIIEKSKQ